MTTRVDQVAYTVRHGSFLRVVYPFSYGTRRLNDDSAFALALDAFRSTGWTAGRSLRPFLLPHVASHIAASEHGPPPRSHIAQMLALEKDGLTKQLGTVSFTMELPGRQVSFAIVESHLALFRFGIGFLALEITPVETELSDWHDAAHYLRFYAEPGSIAGNRQRSLSSPDFPTAPPDMRSILDRLLQLLDPTFTRRSLWRPGQMWGFLSVVIEGPADRDRSFEQYYRLRRFFHRETELITSADHPDDLGFPPLRYGENTYLFHSLDGGGFVAINPPPSHFFNNVIHDHVRGQYYTGFLVAMHLRLLLTRVSSEIITRWTESADDRRRLVEFTETKRQLIEVVARCSFVQIMQGDNHHASYRRWLDVLGIERFQAELEREVRDMHDYLYFVTAAQAQASREAAEKRAAIAEKRFTVAGLAFAAGSLALAVLGVNVNQWTVARGGIDAAPVFAVLGIAIALGLTLGLIIVGRNGDRVAREGNMVPAAAAASLMPEQPPAVLPRASTIIS